MEEILKTIINWLIPVALTGIFVFLKKLLSDNNAMKSSMLSLLRSQLVGKCETYMKQGFLPEYARYCLEDLFKQYQLLGGNHGIEKLVDNTFELPSSINKEETKNEK